MCSLAGCCVGVNYGGKQGEVVVSFKAGAVQVYNVRGAAKLTTGL